MGEVASFWGGVIVWGAVLSYALIAGLSGGDRG